MGKQVEDVLVEVLTKYYAARAKQRAMYSAHEGYAVLKEEVDELWDEIKKREPDVAAMRKEALQIAAMGLAFAWEICDGHNS